MRTDHHVTYGYVGESEDIRQTSGRSEGDHGSGASWQNAWKARPTYTMSVRNQTVLLIVTVCLLLLYVVGTVFFIATADMWMSPDVIPQEHEAKDVPRISRDDFYGKQAVIVHLTTGESVAGVEENTRIYPASLTKVMTLIVVAEHLENENSLQDAITVSQAAFDDMSAAGSSGMGLAVGEKLTVEAMLYALMLQSDGIAATELAKYVAGSEAAFVEMMNQKAQELGLKDTHFVNPTGLHDVNHYSTCRELATMMAYAMNQSLCKQIMTAQEFKASCESPSHGTFHYGIYNNLLYKYFRKYDDLQPSKAGSLTILAGKTGYTPEAGYCLVTCAQDPNGQYYVCVTMGTESYENCIKSYQSLYGKYVG